MSSTITYLFTLLVTTPGEGEHPLNISAATRLANSRINYAKRLNYLNSFGTKPHLTFKFIGFAPLTLLVQSQLRLFIAGLKARYFLAMFHSVLSLRMSQFVNVHVNFHFRLHAGCVSE